MLYALCYVKEEDVVSIYKEHIVPIIENTIDEDEEWQEFSDELFDFGNYYEDTWIERSDQRNRAQPPRFPPAIWNQHNTIMNGGIETNNHLESYNSKLNRLAGTTKNVWEIQELFVKQEADSRRVFQSNRRGSDLSSNTTRRQKVKDKCAAVKFILEGYNTMPKKELIQMLAHRL